ncbi:MAG TPA: hypothetical protein VFW66_11710 [Gemmatimonadales bacterium]|nr:hypothetical protein [Gemmatimonadales bacterium]
MAYDTNDAINSYVTDMLSLEEHVETALKSQLDDLKDYPEILTELRQFHRTVEHHISDLKGLKEARDAGGVASAIKRAGSVAAGAAAGAIDLFRSEGLPKNLRDDYTAFNLAAVGYLMLDTTARSLGQHEPSELGRQHFRDYADAITRLERLIPAAVVRYLQQEGLPASEAVVPDVLRSAGEAWDTGAEQAAEADRPAPTRQV